MKMTLLSPVHEGLQLKYNNHYPFVWFVLMAAVSVGGVQRGRTWWLRRIGFEEKPSCIHAYSS